MSVAETKTSTEYNLTNSYIHIISFSLTKINIIIYTYSRIQEHLYMHTTTHTQTPTHIFPLTVSLTQTGKLMSSHS